MEGVVTLGTQKAAEAERRRLAVEALRIRLRDYARHHGGRFLLFGSAARGQMRYNSDVDILVDFPPEALDDAWVFAEEACRALRLSPDVRPRTWCSAAFLDHVRPDLQVLE